jgi:hypothetical protein
MGIKELQDKVSQFRPLGVIDQVELSSLILFIIFDMADKDTFSNGGLHFFTFEPYCMYHTRDSDILSGTLYISRFKNL